MITSSNGSATIADSSVAIRPPRRALTSSPDSKFVGATVKNPEDVTLFIDDADSILDLQGACALEIYGVVEELSRFDNVCLGITSHISTIPPDCSPLEIATSSVEAVRDAFHHIYKKKEQSDLIDKILGSTRLPSALGHPAWHRCISQQLG